jgi:hypothetical protein
VLCLGCFACSQKKLGSVSDEITHHALCNTIVIKVGPLVHSSCLRHRLLAHSWHIQHSTFCILLL